MNGDAHLGKQQWLDGPQPSIHHPPACHIMLLVNLINSASNSIALPVDLKNNSLQTKELFYHLNLALASGSLFICAWRNHSFYQVNLDMIYWNFTTTCLPFYNINYDVVSAHDVTASLDHVVHAVAHLLDALLEITAIISLLCVELIKLFIPIVGE